MNELVKVSGAELQRPDWESKLDLIKRTIAKGASNDELELFLYHCRKTGLDPLARQIYLVKRSGSATIQTGIDGYRLVADRTGKYAGNDDYEYDNAEERPQWAKARIWKIVEGVRCPFEATARWSQYFPGDSQGFMWKKMPHLMLGKCAEALALRKAFPAELSGLYTKEEMEQADAPRESKNGVSEHQAADIHEGVIEDIKPGQDGAVWVQVSGKTVFLLPKLAEDLAQRGTKLGCKIAVGVSEKKTGTGKPFLLAHYIVEAEAEPTPANPTEPMEPVVISEPRKSRSKRESESPSNGPSDGLLISESDTLARLDSPALSFK